jgi:hypothetical protein
MEYETLKATEEEENLKKLNENNINNNKKISIKKKLY